MKNLLVSLFLLTTICQLDLTSLFCQVYLSKFDDIVINHSVIYEQKNKMIIFTFGYFDPLYKNTTFFGLTKQDGKSDSFLCLDLKLFLFRSSQYNDLIYIKNQNLYASSNDSLEYRYLSLKIQEQEVQELVNQITDNMFSLTCYYAIVYYLFDEIFYVHKQQFSLIYFHPVYHYLPFPDLQKQIQIQQAVQFCKDSFCSSSEIPEIYFYDQFYIKQTIIDPIFSENFKLTNTDVRFEGPGLNKCANVLSINNSINGQTILLLEVDIPFSNISIVVTSSLTTEPDRRLRVLQENNSVKT